MGRVKGKKGSKNPPYRPPQRQESESDRELEPSLLLLEEVATGGAEADYSFQTTIMHVLTEMKNEFSKGIGSIKGEIGHLKTEIGQLKTIVEPMNKKIEELTSVIEESERKAEEAVQTATNLASDLKAAKNFESWVKNKIILQDIKLRGRQKWLIKLNQAVPKREKAPLGI
ncbi:UNVERIFIED_CONTAM: hypothetical protein K2H54_061122 [Gekko kuhli]